MLPDEQDSIGETPDKARLGFSGVEIHKVHLDVHQAVDADFHKDIQVKLRASVEPIEIEATPEPQEDNRFDLVVELKVSAEGYFNLEVLFRGKFAVLGRDIPEEILNSYYRTNAPAIMFPYIRAFVSTLSGNTGKTLPLIVLPPYQFTVEPDGSNVEESPE